MPATSKSALKENTYFSHLISAIGVRPQSQVERLQWLPRVRWNLGTSQAQVSSSVQRGVVVDKNGYKVDNGWIGAPLAYRLP